MAIPTLAALAFVASCGKSLEDVVEPHRAEAEEKLELLNAALDHCRELDAIEEDSPPKVESVVFADRLDRPKGNARTIWLDAFDGKKDYGEAIKSGYSSVPDWWNKTGEALSDSPPHYSDSELEQLDSQFAALNETEYVLIIKTIEYKAPSQTEEDSERYHLGAMSGEVHLYRLKGCEHLGAVIFTAHNQLIGGVGIDFGITSEDPAENIRSLKNRLYGYIHEFAQAAIARSSDGIDSIFEIEDLGPWLPDNIKRRSVKGGEEE